MLGELPGGWNRRPLGHVAEIKKGKIVPTTPIEVSLSLPYIGAAQQVGPPDRWTSSPDAVVCETTDSLLLWDGERSGLAWGGVRGAVSSTVARVRPDVRLVDPGYLRTYLGASFEWIQARRTGTGIPHVPKDLDRILEVPLPPLPEQKKIAAVLSAVDEAIQATQAVIDQTRRVKEGLLQDLLTRGIGHTRFKQTEIGEIPEGWEVRRLDELLSDGPRNGVYKTAGDIGHGTLIIGQTAFTSDRTVDCAAARRARATEDDFARYGLRPKDILITRVYATQEGCGRPAIVTDLPEPAIYESNMMRIRVNEQQSTSGFLFHWLLHPVARRCLMSKSSSSNQTSINQETLGGLACPQPTLREQESILSVLAACDEHVTRARRELAVLTTTKSGLLTDLLTGKVRVTP